jgi:hypothetical protein
LAQGDERQALWDELKAFLGPEAEEQIADDTGGEGREAAAPGA